MRTLGKPMALLCIWAATASSAVFGAQSIAYAAGGTTGSLQGSVTDSRQKPVPGVAVDLVSPSSTAHGVSEASGFYAIPNVAPDTYTVTFSKTGYQKVTVEAVTIVQDQVFRLDQSLGQALQTIGNTRARGASNLVQPNQTADVYVVTSKQLNAAEGGDNVHKTLYNFMQSVPGVVTSGANGPPRIRGATVADLAYEYDGIPINDRLTGLFTTNLSNVGVGSVEVYTGGYSSRYGASQGVINTVIKRGTNPSFGSISMAAQGPLFGHFLQAELGTATLDKKLSLYVAYDGSWTQNAFNNGKYTFPLIPAFGFNGPGPVSTTDVVANIHWNPTPQDDVQFLVQNGNGKFDFNYLMSNAHPVTIVPCTGYKAPGGVPTVGGVSDTGLPCVAADGTPTGLQYRAIPWNSANNWYHYSGLGKIQWNHTFNDKLSGYLRLAENFNQYLFNQPYDDPNFANTIHTGDVALGFGNDNGADDFFGDRRSQMYIGSFELNYTANEKSSYYLGASYERDNSAMHYYDREGINSGAPAGGSAFDVNGNWPNLYLAADYPLFLPSVYFGTTQRLGRFTLEPSLRYEGQEYKTPAGPYYVSSWQPRFAFSYAANNSTVVRGSYAVTSLPVPASYVFNSSPDGVSGTGTTRSPFVPGANVQPSRDYNTDLSLEHLFPNGVSLKVTPFYHHSANKLAFFRNYTFVNGVPKFSGLSLPKAGGEVKDTGVELGLNRQTPGDGLSYYLAATYVNALSSSQNTSTVTNSFSNVTDFLLNKSLYPQIGTPPLSVSMTADYTKMGWHLLPNVLYQCCSPYNIFQNQKFYDPATNSKTVVDTMLHHSPAYWFANLTLSKDLHFGRRSTETIGVRVSNLFNNLKADVPPSVNSCYNYTANKAGNVCTPTGTVYDGGYAVFTPGQVPATQYFYPPITQNARTVEFFLTSKF